MIISGKNFEISEDVAERILTLGSSFSSFWVTKSLVETEIAGNHTDKAEIAYNGVDTFAMRRLTFSFLMKDYLSFDFQKPLCTAVFRVNKSLPEKTVRQVISGREAKGIFWREALAPHYSKEEAVEAMSKHTADYSRAKRQLHLIPTDYPQAEAGVVYRVPNVVDWDINGAHGFMLTKIFPRSKGEIKAMYEKRREDEVYKQVLNYTVGMFARDGYRGTYNWIVQGVTDMLLQKLREEADGFPLYVNTDGATLAYDRDISRIKGVLELGGWKVEAKGDLFFYLSDGQGSSRYWAMQIGDTLKGTLSVSARKGCDLSKGIVPEYRRTLENCAGVDFYRVSDLRFKRTEIREFDVNG